MEARKAHAPVVEWRTRQTAKRLSHLFVDGVCACTNGRKPIGSTSPYQGRAFKRSVTAWWVVVSARVYAAAAVQPFAPAELAADGKPFGIVCRNCESVWMRWKKGAR
jgi:hypothetical protein